MFVGGVRRVPVHEHLGKRLLGDILQQNSWNTWITTRIAKIEFGENIIRGELKNADPEDRGFTTTGPAGELLIAKLEESGTEFSFSRRKQSSLTQSTDKLGPSFHTGRPDGLFHETGTGRGHEGDELRKKTARGCSPMNRTKSPSRTWQELRRQKRK